jgi:hypothetical protein
MPVHVTETNGNATYCPIYIYIYILMYSRNVSTSAISLCNIHDFRRISDYLLL